MELMQFQERIPLCFGFLELLFIGWGLWNFFFWPIFPFTILKNVGILFKLIPKPPLKGFWNWTSKTWSLKPLRCQLRSRFKDSFGSRNQIISPTIYNWIIKDQRGSAFWQSEYQHLLGFRIWDFSSTPSWQFNYHKLRVSEGGGVN